jgi:hypothetical protein
VPGANRHLAQVSTGITRARDQWIVGYNDVMRYMVIEGYKLGSGPVYERAASQGRMLPDGLRYIDSWIVDDGKMNRCFQLMETNSPELLDEWQARWADLVDFEVLPVITSKEAAQRSGAG